MQVRYQLRQRPESPNPSTKVQSLLARDGVGRPPAKAPGAPRVEIRGSWRTKTLGGPEQRNGRRRHQTRPRAPPRADRRGRLHRFAERHRTRPDRRDRRGPPRARARPRHRAGHEPLRGAPHVARLQPAGAREHLREDPDPPPRAAGRRRRARPGPPHLVALLHRHRTRRAGAADPRRRPVDPPAPAARPDHLQHHVGHHRLHRGERRHPGRPGKPPARRSAQPARAVRHRCRRNGEGQRAGVGREPLARRRGQPHRSAPGRDRHELLRRLHPTTGEPATWRSTLAGPDIPAPPPGAHRLLRLQRPHRSHRQEEPGPGRPRLGNEGVDMVWDLLDAGSGGGRAQPGPPARCSPAGRAGPCTV